MALVAAILGWLFDGFEMGLFPLVMKPALRDLLSNGIDIGSLDPKRLSELEALVGKWEGIMHAGFLIGAATGGVLFGWLGDRLGRVRAMSLSILTFALFSALCGLGNSAGLVLFFRFVASLGMGGEWSLGIALVNFMFIKSVFSDESNHSLVFMMLAATMVLLSRVKNAPRMPFFGR